MVVSPAAKYRGAAAASIPTPSSTSSSVWKFGP